MENLTDVITGAVGAIAMLSVGAGLGVTSTLPDLSPTMSIAVRVMVPATVPVASTGEPENTAAVDPAAMEKLTLLEPPPEVMNWTSVGLPPTADWKLTDSVPDRSTGNELPRDRLTEGCVAAVPVMVPMVTEDNGGRLTVIVMACVAVCCCESVTYKVTFEVPAAVGFPLMAPLLLNCNPAGSVPEEIDQV